MKKLKLAMIIAALSVVGSASALEINIKADSINYKPVILGKMDNGLKDVIFNDLSKINNLKIEKSPKECSDVVKNLNTSYYCVDENVADNKYALRIKEKYRDKSNDKGNVTLPMTNEKLSELGHVYSNGLYKSLYGKESVFNSKLAYVERTDLKDGKNIFKLKISDYDGKNSKTLLSSPQPILAIDWSNNNEDIAYVSYESVRSSVFIQNLKTMKRIKVASFKGINAFPSWSPNGKMLAISLSKDGKSDIYVYSLEKHHLKKITNFKETAVEPVWISNSELLFTYERSGIPSLYKLSLKKGNVIKVSKNFFNTTTAKMTGDKKYAYSVFAQNGKAGILKTNINNRNETIFVNDKNAESPSVGKGDEIIIFSTKKHGKSILKAVDQRGLEVYSISNSKELKEPSYSK